MRVANRSKLWMLGTGVRRGDKKRCFDGRVAPNVMAIYSKLVALGLEDDGIVEFKECVYQHRLSHPRMRYR